MSATAGAIFAANNEVKNMINLSSSLDIPDAILVKITTTQFIILKLGKLDNTGSQFLYENNTKRTDYALSFDSSDGSLLTSGSTNVIHEHSSLQDYITAGRVFYYGSPGSQGPQGATVSGSTVDGNGDLILTVYDPSDNSTVFYNTGNVIGPQGIQGVQGFQGLGLSSASVDSSGDLIVEKLDPSDSSTVNINAGNVIGPQGEKGDTGSQGIQGIKGDKGDAGDKGDTGNKGDTGSQGDQGIQGVKGDEGNQGPQGDQGVQGIQGDTSDSLNLTTSISNPILQVSDTGKIYFETDTNRILIWNGSDFIKYGAI